MKRRNKILLIVGITLVSLMAGLVILLYLAYRDESPSDDSDLVVQRLDIPDDQNGFFVLSEIDKVLYWPGKTDEALSEDQKAAEESRATRLTEMVDDKNWDDALAQEVLSRNEATLALAAKLMARPHFQLPEATSLDSFTSEELFATLSLARIMAIRAYALNHAGQTSEALNRAVEVARLGHRMENGKGTLVEYLVGLTVKDMGYNAVRHLLSEPSLSPQELSRLAQRLKEFSDDNPGLADAFRNEYWFAAHATEDWKAGRFSLGALMTLDLAFRRF